MMYHSFLKECLNASGYNHLGKGNADNAVCRSAFNTIVPTKLVPKLRILGHLPLQLNLGLFLTGRTQAVRMGSLTSSCYSIFLSPSREIYFCGFLHPLLDSYSVSAATCTIVSPPLCCFSVGFTLHQFTYYFMLYLLVCFPYVLVCT